MKPLLALQGENMLQWTRSTEPHTAVEIWNHLSLVLGLSQLSLCTPKTNKRQWKFGLDRQMSWGYIVVMSHAWSHPCTCHVVFELNVSTETGLRSWGWMMLDLPFYNVLKCVNLDRWCRSLPTHLKKTVCSGRFSCLLKLWTANSHSEM